MLRCSPNERHVGCFQCLLCKRSLVWILARHCLCACVFLKDLNQKRWVFVSLTVLDTVKLFYDFRAFGCAQVAAEVPAQTDSVSEWVTVRGQVSGFQWRCPRLVTQVLVGVATFKNVRLRRLGDTQLGWTPRLTSVRSAITSWIIMYLNKDGELYVLHTTQKWSGFWGVRAWFQIRALLPL